MAGAETLCAGMLLILSSSLQDGTAVHRACKVRSRSCMCCIGQTCTVGRGLTAVQTMAEMPMEQMEPASRGLFSPVVATVIAP